MLPTFSASMKGIFCLLDIFCFWKWVSCTTTWICLPQVLFNQKNTWEDYRMSTKQYFHKSERNVAYWTYSHSEGGGWIGVGDFWVWEEAVAVLAAAGGGGGSSLQDCVMPPSCAWWLMNTWMLNETPVIFLLSRPPMIHEGAITTCPKVARLATPQDPRIRHSSSPAYHVCHSYIHTQPHQTAIYSASLKNFRTESGGIRVRWGGVIRKIKWRIHLSGVLSQSLLDKIRPLDSAPSWSTRLVGLYCSSLERRLIRQHGRFRKARIPMRHRNEKDLALSQTGLCFLGNILYMHQCIDRDST